MGTERGCVHGLLGVQARREPNGAMHCLEQYPQADSCNSTLLLAPESRGLLALESGPFRGQFEKKIVTHEINGGLAGGGDSDRVHLKAYDPPMACPLCPSPPSGLCVSHTVTHPVQWPPCACGALWGSCDAVTGCTGAVALGFCPLVSAACEGSGKMDQTLREKPPAPYSKSYTRQHPPHVTPTMPHVLLWRSDVAPAAPASLVGGHPLAPALTANGLGDILNTYSPEWVSRPTAFACLALPRRSLRRSCTSPRSLSQTAVPSMCQAPHSACRPGGSARHIWGSCSRCPAPPTPSQCPPTASCQAAITNSRCMSRTPPLGCPRPPAQKSPSNAALSKCRWWGRRSGP